MSFISYIHQGATPNFYKTSFNQTKPLGPSPESTVHEQSYINFWQDKKIKCLSLVGFGIGFATIGVIGAVAAGVVALSVATGVLPLIIGAAVVVTLVALAILGIVTAAVAYKRALEAKHLVELLSRPEKFQQLTRIIKNKEEFDEVFANNNTFFAPLNQTKELMLKKNRYDLIVQQIENRNKHQKDAQVDAVETFHKEHQKIKNISKADEELHKFLSGHDIPDIITEKQDLYNKNAFNLNVKNNQKHYKSVIRAIYNEAVAAINQPLVETKHAAELHFAAQIFGLKREDFKVLPFDNYTAISVYKVYQEFCKVSHTNFINVSTSFNDYLDRIYRGNFIKTHS